MRILFLTALIVLFLGAQAQYLGDECPNSDFCYSNCCNPEIFICDWPSVCGISAAQLAQTSKP